MQKIKEFEDRIEYYKYRKLHRDNDLPAIEYLDGSEEWYQNGLRHRDNGPAVEWKDGNKCWYQNGLLHRLDGPAHEGINGYKSWYICGKVYTEEEYNKIISGKNEIDKLKKEIAEKDEIIKKMQEQSKYEVRKLKDRTEYLYEGKIHRDNDLPAIEWNDGVKSWFQNGLLHRDNGPACEWPDGHKEWFQNDKPHRLDGPAVEYANGKKEWWVKGKQYIKLTDQSLNINGELFIPK